MAEYDLTKTIIPYCDRHLVFPLLAHLAESELFPTEQVQAAQYELAKETNMVDYAVSLFQQLNPDDEAPQGMNLSIIARHTLNSLQNSRTSAKRLSPPTSSYNRRRRPCWMSLRNLKLPSPSVKTRTRTCSSCENITVYVLIPLLLPLFPNSVALS